MDIGDSYPMQPSLPRSSLIAARNPPPFRLDEGFSEDIRNQDYADQMGSGPSALAFEEWVMAQSEEARSEIAYEVLRTLRTSNIAAVVERLTPLLHMDPVDKLPPEITAEIFGLLDASTLLTASLASKSWRERILDSRLWKRLYAAQGWAIDAAETKSFEEAQTTHNAMVRDEFRNGKAPLRAVNNNSHQPVNKKRATSSWLGQRGRNDSGDIAQWREQHGVIEADGDSPHAAPPSSADQEMHDAPGHEASLSPHRRKKRISQDSGDEMELEPRISNLLTLGVAVPSQLHPPLVPSLLLDEPSQYGKINWSYLYKQRRRLEDNWAKGRYTNFQLPHPLYPHEAHKECVYTIQFFGKWLVSGSRDKTLRVWDLETRRLRGPPLTGHTQSVLCLQFDPTEGEDVIISGSSDTSVIIWRFSTGQEIHKLPQAHRESVLNLRFDHRYLVTCSKDKLIKVWNRHELLPTDPSYPQTTSAGTAKLPSYIIDTSSISPSVLEAKTASRRFKPLAPYTLIMVLDGHTAAVNAIQIDKDIIVSASGDRYIKMWRLPDGKLLHTLSGHQKGIACVQSDSRRIVSGSSDNTVRIYDHAAACEVACLRGHTNLVRTVQAGFGDLPGSEQEYIQQARTAERQYEESLASGTIVEPELSARSRRPVTRRSLMKEFRAYGAKIPPGGGGSQWGRIVSGSYDETIIIWKKDADGRWIVGHCLRQEAAVQASSTADLRAYNGTRIDAGGAPASTLPLASLEPSPAPSDSPVPSAGSTAQQAVQTSMAGLQTGIQNVMNIGSSLGSGGAGLGRPAWMAPGVQQAMAQLQSHARNVQRAAITALAESQPAPSQPANASTQPPPPPPQSQPQTPPAPQSTAVDQQSQTAGHQHHHHHHAHNHNHNHNHGNANTNAAANTNNPNPNPNPIVPAAAAVAAAAAAQSVSRVFKLQFDARRIICCSQDPRIVGWDFAAGDPDIIEASRYFVGP